MHAFTPPGLHHPLLDFLFPHSFGMSMITLLSIVPLAYTTPSESEPALDQFRFATVYSNDMVLSYQTVFSVFYD